VVDLCPRHTHFRFGPDHRIEAARGTVVGIVEIVVNPDHRPVADVRRDVRQPSRLCVQAPSNGRCDPGGDEALRRFVLAQPSRLDTAWFADHLDKSGGVVSDLPFEALRAADHVAVELPLTLTAHDVPRMLWRNFPEPSSRTQNDQPLRMGLMLGLL
jgi:hypothetical protein